MDGDTSVKVAVKLRPLVPSETEQGSRECLKVTPGAPQVPVSRPPTPMHLPLSQAVGHACVAGVSLVEANVSRTETEAES